MKTLNKNDLNNLKEQLNHYKFSIRDKNGLQVQPNYVSYILQLRHDSEYIDTFVNNIIGSENSKEDISLISEYMDYIEQLIKICQYVIKDMNRTRWEYKEMTKKYAINLAVEQESRLFDNYNSLVSELINLIK